MRGLVLRFGGFLGIPVLSAIAPFLILPFVSRAAGADGWGNVSAGQAIGVLGVVFISFGWNVYGPPAVAQATDEATRHRLYHESVRARVAVSVVVVPVVAAVTALVVGASHRWDAVAMAVAMAVVALLPSWYCIGIGQPALLARYDVLPRMAATVVTIPIVALTGQIWPYPVLQVVVIAFAAYLFGRRIVPPPHREDRHRRPSLLSIMRPTAHIAALDAVGNSYATTPVPIAAASLAPADASAFGSADRAYRIGLSVVVVALANAFQGWVLDPGARDQHRRQTTALAAHVVTGVAGGLLLWVLGPWATGLFFGTDVAGARTVCAWYGLSFLALSVSTPLMRNLLIPAGRGRYILGATVVASVGGLAVMGVGAVQHDAVVIAAGLALSESLITLVLIPPALHRLRRLQGPRASTTPVDSAG